jgi:hypothetical protein
MSSSTNQKDTKEPTIKEKINSSLSTIRSMAIYILMGLTLCYLKIILGDLARDSKLSHQSFTENAVLVMRETTPTINFYCKENKTNYVKQAFVYNPNFIKEYITNHFSTSGKDQLLKFISLEFIYVILSAISILEGIPNWIVILIGPIVYGLIFLSMFFFMWLMLSYYIFNYFLNGGHLFSLIGLGWFVGFIVWLLVMVYLSVFTVPVAIIYGFVQFMYILRKANVRVLIPSKIDNIINNNISIDETNDSVPYGFMNFLGDMFLTSATLQLLICYTIYTIFSYFTTYAYVVIVFFIIIFAFFQGPITFLKKDGLENKNWTTHTESVKLLYPQTMMDSFRRTVMNGINIAKEIFGAEAIDKVTQKATETLGEDVVNQANTVIQNPTTDNVKKLGKKLVTQGIKKVAVEPGINVAKTIATGLAKQVAKN